MLIGTSIEQEPNYIVLTSQELERFTNKSLKEFGIIDKIYRKGKPIYRDWYKYSLEWFADLWHVLPSRKNIEFPSEYNDILNVANLLNK